VLAPRASDGRGQCCVSSLPWSLGRHWTKRRAKAFPAMVSTSTSAASSGVVALLGGGVLGCFLLWFVSSGWKHFFDSSEER
jgi:hypothetical protein